jgi:hypothetical protein
LLESPSHPVKDLKMVRVEDNEDPEELDYSNAPSPEYIMEDLIKILTLKNPTFEGGSEDVYQEFINQVVIKVHDVENEY